MPIIHVSPPCFHRCDKTDEKPQLRNDNCPRNFATGRQNQDVENGYNHSRGQNLQMVTGLYVDENTRYNTIVSQYNFQGSRKNKSSTLLSDFFVPLIPSGGF